jgi:hypothetical protein
MANEKTGISKAMFAAGLIAAILVSSIISVVIMTQIPSVRELLRGDKGDKGDIGATGPQGLKGDKGDPATVTFAKWDVSWHTFTGDMQPGPNIGNSTFCSTFDYDWGTGIVFTIYDDYIGFTATMQVKMQRSGPVTFTVGSDDGHILYLDGAVVVTDFATAHGYRTQTAIRYLSFGLHTLTLEYRETTGSSRVSFECDSDILTWTS